MQRIGGSMSMYFNAKYGGSGSIFQGSFKGKTVDTDTYLRHLLYYIVVKNVFELYPGGLVAALQQFDEAWEWALAYQFASLAVCAIGKDSPIIDMPALIDLGLRDHRDFKQEAKEMLLTHIESKSEGFNSLILECW
jgi:hypothetical protein